MKTSVYLTGSVAAFLATSSIHAAPTESEFIRKPGQYSLDTKGSTLTITEQPARTWSLKVMWRSGDATDTTAPDDCLRAEGWFVFVEKPGRLWIYDGREGGILVIHSQKQSSVSAFSSSVMSSCPQKVWNALPQSVREKYRKPNERIEPMTSSALMPVLQSSAIRALLVPAHPNRSAELRR